MTATARADRRPGARGDRPAAAGRSASPLRELRVGPRAASTSSSPASRSASPSSPASARCRMRCARGFERQGEALLGGDVTLCAHARRADGRRARAGSTRQGASARPRRMRAMARRLDGREQALVELKGVDAAYPLVGAVRARRRRAACTTRSARAGAVVDPILLERLRPEGRRSASSSARPRCRSRGAIEAEPDKHRRPPHLRPARVRLARDARQDRARQAGHAGALALCPEARRRRRGERQPASAAFRERVEAALPEAGFTIADRRDPSPQVTRTLERLRQFLTLVGLTALLVGGVGVANAVATFIDRRRKVIATMKSLGATSRMVFAIFLVQVLVIAAHRRRASASRSARSRPSCSTRCSATSLPIKAELTVIAASVVTAAAYGLLVALLFTLWPLGRAEQVSASVLFRDEVAPERVLAAAARHRADARHRRWRCSRFAVLTSESQRIALYFCLGARRRVRRVLGLGTSSPGRRAACRGRACRELALAHRQSRRAGRAHALGRAVARRRPVAARRRGAGRRLARRAS